MLVFFRLVVGTVLLLGLSNSLLAAEPNAREDVVFKAAMSDAVRAAAVANLEAVVAIEVIGAGDTKVGEIARGATTSGVIVDPSGLVLAAGFVAHERSATLIVVLPGGRRLAAEVVARDEHRDLVLLQANAPAALKSVSLSRDVPIEIGQSVVAVGRYGAGGDPIVSSGVLSGQDRLDGIALQTDARVSPSLYGGLMVDLRGRPLGVLIPAVAQGGAEAETSWYDAGVAFAIPTSGLIKSLERLRTGRDVRKGLMGIVARTADPMDDDTTIAAVRGRSPAAAAGLQPGDEILAIAGRSVRRHQQIRQVLGRYDAEDSLDLEIRRGSESIQVTVTLAGEIPPLRPQRLGILGSDVSEVAAADGEQAAEKAKQAETGVQVDSVVAGTAADGQLRPGDRIVAVNDRPITGVASLRRRLAVALPEAELNVGVDRDGGRRTVKIKTQSIDGVALTSLSPEKRPTATDERWRILPVKLPEIVNAAAVLRPDLDEAGPPSRRLGLYVLLLNPGTEDPAEELRRWRPAAVAAGVVVCAVRPQDDQRWKPQEIESVTRITTAVIQQSAVAPHAVALGAPGALSDQPAAAADSMALVAALVSKATFFGVAIGPAAKVPAIRMRQNEPLSSLQLFLAVTEAVDLPEWSFAFQKSGYPVARGGDDVDTDVILRWVRNLAVI